MSMLIQQVINGLVIGCIYGLLGLGYSMVYGVLRMVNFAHGEMFMLGPMSALAVLLWTGVVSKQHSSNLVVPLSGLGLVGLIAVCFAIGVLVAVAAGLGMEKLVFRRLRGAPSRNLMLSSLGLSIVLANTAMLTLGANLKGFPRMLPTRYYGVMGAVFSNMHLVVAVATASLMVGLLHLVNRTYLGRCIRAVAEDRDAASLMGVDVDRTIASVFVLGPAVGAFSGVLFSMYYEQAYFGMGSIIGMKGWTAAVLGGIGNLGGTVVAGLLLGMLESVGGGYLPLITKGRLGFEYKDILAFIVLVIVLRFRPQGLFGGTTR